MDFTIIPKEEWTGELELPSKMEADIIGEGDGWRIIKTSLVDGAITYIFEWPTGKQAFYHAKIKREEEEENEFEKVTIECQSVFGDSYIYWDIYNDGLVDTNCSIQHGRHTVKGKLLIPKEMAKSAIESL